MIARFSMSSRWADSPGGSPSASVRILRTRSTTRASRLLVDIASVPDAEMSTAGVIIAPRMSPATDDCSNIGKGMRELGDRENSRRPVVGCGLADVLLDLDAQRPRHVVVLGPQVGEEPA